MLSVIEPNEQYKEPVVSILILTYNRLKLTQECIPKILDNIGEISNEVLIWDNGSTDGTLDWLAQYGQADVRISKVFTSEKNYGLEAINFLAQEANGKFLLKVDDDVEVPRKFAKRIVRCYEQADEPRILYLTWDMDWQGSSFALRSGKKLYKNELGTIINVDKKHRLLITFQPSQWMVNGVVRLCQKKDFIKVGGHPKGMIYGIDHKLNIIAEEHGFWCAYLNGSDYVFHLGTTDTAEQRAMKNRELKRAGGPLHV